MLHLSMKNSGLNRIEKTCESVYTTLVDPESPSLSKVELTEILGAYIKEYLMAINMFIVNSFHLTSLCLDLHYFMMKLCTEKLISIILIDILSMYVSESSYTAKIDNIEKNHCNYNFYYLLSYIIEIFKSSVLLNRSYHWST